MSEIPKSLCHYKRLCGRAMKTEAHFRSDETLWLLLDNYKIEDDTIYDVWYTRKDSADSSDSSTYYKVHYIEKH